MRIEKVVLASVAACFLSVSAFAQSSGGMSGGANMGDMKAPPKMTLNAQGGFDIFSRQDMATMIVDREKATMGMTADQAKAARQEEMAKDQAETPDQREARKQRYDSEWAKLPPTEKSAALAKYHTQLVSMGIDDPAK